MKQILTINLWLYDTFIRPKSAAIDSRRQEYILNILLSALGLVASLSLIVSGLHYLDDSVRHYASSFMGTLVFSCVIYVLIALSRSGHFRISSIIFVTILSLMAVQLCVTYSFELTPALMLFTLIITMTGVLMGARAGLGMTVGIALFVLTLAYFQLHHKLSADISWFEDDFNMGDAIGFSFLFGIIGIVTWLSNREIDRSLRRARASEAELAAERDSLEIKVIERTRQLEETQLLRTIELQRFAKFGRLSANLLHEMINPLTAASLNLQMHEGQPSEQVITAQRNLQQIERYVTAARMQLQNQSTIVNFSVRSELKHIVDAIRPLARANNLRLNIAQMGNYTLTGDPVKFNQLIGNLVLNAIDASQNAEPRIIELTVKANDRYVIIDVTDHGSGIAKEILRHIFEPFFSTKSDHNRGIGIGLALVKDFVEQDFKGTVHVSSQPGKGSKFSVRLRRQK